LPLGGAKAADDNGPRVETTDGNIVWNVEQGKTVGSLRGERERERRESISE
jgi:hypothetical protein